MRRRHARMIRQIVREMTEELHPATPRPDSFRKALAKDFAVGSAAAVVVVALWVRYLA